MTITLSAAVSRHLNRSTTLTFAASGVESDLAQTWFLIGNKRTSGAPTTVADLLERRPGRLLDFDQASYSYSSPATCKAVLKDIVLSSTLPGAAAGDNLYLAVTSGTADTPGGAVTFDAIKPLGVIQA